MKRVRSVVAEGAGGPEVLKLVERELQPLGDHEILVQVQAAGINRPDVFQRMGEYPPPAGVSDVLGLELAGNVVEIGEKVSRFLVGDRVMALVASGAYAELAIAHEDVAIAIPDTLDYVEAGAVPETFFTVWSNVFERAALQSGETLLVHSGTSGIGTTAIQLAKAFGCKVLVTCGSDEKCEAAVRVGADHAINYREADFVTEARRFTGAPGPMSSWTWLERLTSSGT